MKAVRMASLKASCVDGLGKVPRLSGLVNGNRYRHYHRACKLLLSLLLNILICDVSHNFAISPVSSR